MAITTRAGKGSALSYAEVDENFTDLRDGVGMMVPKEKTAGIKVDSLGTPTYGWHDIHGSPLFNPANINAPGFAIYRGNIEQIQMAEGNEFTINFHIPHDYVEGSDLFIHAHWSHNSTLVTGGSVTWNFESTYAKGFDQAAFSTPLTVAVVQNASTTQYQHMVAEGAMSVSGGSGTQLNSDVIEVDGVIFCTFSLNSNDITSSGAVPNPFLHFVDIHYQSTNVSTKNKAPNFYGV